MAYTTINKSTDYFNTVLYTGNGSARTITTGMQPDLNWIKRRNQVDNHWWTDSVRGATKYIGSNRTNAEATETTAVTGITSTGFTLGADTNQGEVNANTYTYCSWNWKANGAGSANTDGSINSTVSVNTTAGFSIVKFTGSGANATVGHGLGVAPKMYILKRIDGGTNAWLVYHDGLDTSSPQNYRCVLNQDTARQDMTTWNDTAPTNSVFSVGSDSEVNGSGQTYIVYCFAEKTGYSKFGSYTGNGNADGTFVYTGFKPAFVLLKQSHAVRDWFIFDNKRSGANGANPGGNHYLQPNTNAAETVNERLDLLSNGFKFKTTNVAWNENGGSYIYMAFGQSIVGSNNVPATAR